MTRKKKKKNIKIVFIIFVILLLTMSIGYSALYEKLSLTGTAKLNNESKDNNYDIEYKVTSWQSGKYEYQFNPVTITYKATEDVNTWKIVIDVPDDSTLSACWNVKCKIEDGKLIIRNDNNNAIIKPGGILTNFGFQIATSMENYEFNVEEVNFYTPTNPNPDEQIITDGLSVNYSKSGGWVSGNKFVSQININVNNNTGIDLSYWELVIKRPANSKIQTLWGASYVEKEDTIIITGENGIANFFNGSSKSIGIQIELETQNVELETSTLFGKGIIE